MDHLRPFGVRKAKVGADGKRVAYLVSPAAVAVFTFIGALLLGAAVYYSWALEAQVRDLKVANGWEESDNLDEETRLAHHFFHSAEILVNILQSEQQTVEDGVIVSEAVLQEIETLKAQVDAAKSLDQILALVDKFDTTVTNIVSSYAEANDVLSTRAKMLSKALARALASKGSEGTADEIDDMPEWKQISTWNQISRCFGFVTDVNVVEIPTHVQELLAAELDALESESFPTGNYMRPTDVREEMQQVLTSEEVHGIRPNIIHDASTPEQVKEILREVIQVLVVQKNLDPLEELETQWTVDGLGDDEVLTKLEALEADGILPLFWIAGGFIVRHIFLARLVASF
eukprot:INCI17123.3.p2 GENE.INCI17123.3~~INCI17123.3.p2  ORF type:complete len:345 (-),score=77.83 INCI17123.3:1539-2573(-)